MADNTSIVVQWSYPVEETDDDTTITPNRPSTQDEDGFDIGVILEQEDVAGGQDPCARDADSNNLVVGIYAYVNPSDLNYKITATRGTLSPGVKNEGQEFTDTVDFDMEDQATLDYRISNLSSSWEGIVLNSELEEITGPTPSFSGNTITLPYPVYGTLRISGEKATVDYTLTVPPLEGAEPEDRFNSKVVATWDGGISDLDIRTPNTETCREDWEINPDADLKCWKIVVTLDPCTGEEEERTAPQRIACSDG